MATVWNYTRQHNKKTINSSYCDSILDVLYLNNCCVVRLKSNAAFLWISGLCIWLTDWDNSCGWQGGGLQGAGRRYLLFWYAYPDNHPFSYSFCWFNILWGSLSITLKNLTSIQVSHHSQENTLFTVDDSETSTVKMLLLVYLWSETELTYVVAGVENLVEER